MIGFTGVHTYENKDWLTQLPFILINAGQYSTAQQTSVAYSIVVPAYLLHGLLTLPHIHMQCQA